MQFAITAIGVLCFAGLTAYDTQRIKEMYDVNDDGTVTGRKAVTQLDRLARSTRDLLNVDQSN